MGQIVFEDERLAQWAAQVEGIKVYNNPYPCNACGGFQRYTSNRLCVPCALEREDEMKRPRGRARKSTPAALLDLAHTRLEAIERGQKWYFPGAVCQRGHQDKRSVRTNACYSCQYPKR